MNDDPTLPQPTLSRRTVLRAAAGTALGMTAAALSPSLAQPSTRPEKMGSETVAGRSAAGNPTVAPLFRDLDTRIRAAIAEYHIPGAAVAVYHRGQEFVRGYGVTNVDHPQPVDEDTLFRIGSVTKTFTATTIMRLVEQGKMALDAPVRSYLPDVRLADKAAAARITVRQLLDHSSGFLGEYYPDFGRGADALERYVAGIERLPQMTPPGEVFAYNNAAVVLAGRVIEVVANKPFENVVQEQLLGPLGLDHTFFFSDQIIGYNLAASHAVVDGVPAVRTEWWRLWRSLHPTGGLISSARDLLRYARLHLGRRAAADGPPLLSEAARREMQSRSGPGGTYTFEVEGVGVNWMLRPTVEGAPVLQWDGDWPGQAAGFLFVPGRDFAIALLTNADSGPRLRSDLLDGDWALEHFGGLHLPPAVPLRRTPAQLAPYEGEYWAQSLASPSGAAEETVITMKAADGVLRTRLSLDGAVAADGSFAFYRDDHVVALDTAGQPTPGRSDFVRGPDGRVTWFRFGGRLHRRVT